MKLYNKIRVFLRQYFIPVISFLIIYFLVIYSYIQVKEKTNQQRTEYFESRAYLVKTSINNRILDYIQILKGGKAFIESSDSITRKEWKRYISSLDVDQNYPGIQGIGYAIFIKPEDLQKHINKIRASGFPSYTITPSGVRKEYTSIIFLEPFTGRNLRAFGYDMYSEPVRRRAMERAMETGKPALTGKLTLIQETGDGNQPGFLIYVPVYNSNDSSSSLLTTEQRRQSIKGFVYSPFRSGDLFNALLPARFSDLNIEIYNGEELTKDALLFSTRKNGTLEKKGEEFKKYENINIGGTNWIIYISSKPFFGGRESNDALLILVGGSVISFLIFFILLIRSEAKRINRLKQTITDTVTAAIFVINRNGFVTFINPAVTKITGYRPEDFREKTFYDVMHQSRKGPYKNFDPARNIYQTILQGIHVHDQEDILISKDGRLFPALCSASPILENGVPLGTLVEVKDITGEKKAKETIAKNLETKNFLLEAMPDKVWTADGNGIFNFFGHNWEQYSGHTINEFLKKGMDLITYFEDKVQNDKTITQLLQEHKPFQIEHRFKREDGEYRWHLTRGFPQMSKNGDVEMWVGTSTDIHEQKLQLEELKMINVDLDNFIYTASHDLKAPISNMEGLVDALKIAGENKDERSELIELMNKSLLRLGRTINDLTEIAKIQKQKDWTNEVVKFSEIVEEVIEDLQRFIEEADAKINLEFNVSAIKFSKKNLRSIFYNLISNAIKYKKSDTAPIVDVRTFLEKDKIVIFAKDNGLGIKQENKKRVFEMFRRLHAHVEGSGMGLYIVKRIVENAGGTIDIESKAGEGTTFRIYLPAENLLIRK
ncbi:MAG: CHASE domain-containing protein [Sporocytophaga sp.]|uniref:CHASE domain-containing protein n=1 Tax=Sporocytophaga sp. TaxID=2231183 RepID=UPI001B29A7BD|nr:CHASE domain-containing protein [Sporocytophaga sp.]MBO9702196.1 CHASE domain-containing protein [Sporocytophaga sp.]